jgi:hypothetical protein
VFTVSETAFVAAPIARCFALSTDVELVQRTLGLRLVGGVTTGHVELGSRVVWRGWKFGLPAEHHTLITLLEPPHAGRIGDPAAAFEGQPVAWFEDSQEKGRFAAFRHLHLFREVNGITQLEDHVTYSLPFGPLSGLVARLLLTPHIRKLTRQRFQLLQRIAEAGD